MAKLTADIRKKLKKPAARPDRETNREMRELPPDAVIVKFHRPRKESVTMRIDSDVLAWLKASGYQTRINEYLRRLMRQSRKGS
ncbi:MAG: BrnA antitoxin family protein [Acidobacteria bacterium]|nr:BrnA antitoxin family protein [Acidobacteriota bacterium]